MQRGNRVVWFGFELARQQRSALRLLSSSQCAAARAGCRCGRSSGGGGRPSGLLVRVLVVNITPALLALLNAASVMSAHTHDRNERDTYHRSVNGLVTRVVQRIALPSIRTQARVVRLNVVALRPAATAWLVLQTTLAAPSKR
jgi:hypothetical protein